MSTLRVTNIQHPNAEDPAIELSPSGGVLLSGAGDVPSGSTGVPWFLPYPEPGEAFGTQAVEDLADAVADGLSAAGGLVAVKHAVFTGVQTQSVGAGSNFVISGLSIDHSLKNASNSLILFGYMGLSQHSTRTSAIGIHSSVLGFLQVGDASGNRTRINAAGGGFGGNSAFVYVSPGNTNSATYTLRAINAADSSATTFVNARSSDSNFRDRPRSASALLLMEVKV